MEYLQFLIFVLLFIFFVLAIKIFSVSEKKDNKIKYDNSDLGIVNNIFSIILYPVWFIFFIFTCFTLLPIVILSNPKYIAPIVRFYGRLLLIGFGIIIKIKGKEKLKRKKPYLLLFNHSSIIDIFILPSITYKQVTALAASYQFKLPIWGTIIKRYGIIPVERKNRNEAIKSVKIAEDKIKKGISVFISPEGTRTTSGELNSFKKGPFYLAKAANADILVVVFKGAFSAKRKTDWRIKPGKVNVIVGDFIYYKDYKNLSIDELKKISWEKMNDLLKN